MYDVHSMDEDEVHKVVGVQVPGVQKINRNIDYLFDMINAFIVYHDKRLVFIGATFREKLMGDELLPKRSPDKN